MEVMVICSIEMIQAIERVDRRVRLDRVEQNGQPKTMSCVDQLHQVLRSTLAIRRKRCSVFDTG